MVNRSRKFEHAQKSARYAFKTALKRAIKKTAGAAGDLIGNKIADRNAKVSKNSQQNNSETVTIEYNIKKYLNKDIYLQEKGKKLLII